MNHPLRLPKLYHDPPLHSPAIALDRILTSQVSTTQPAPTKDAIEKAHHEGRQDMRAFSIRLASSDVSSASHTTKVAYAHARGSVAGTCARSGVIGLASISESSIQTRDQNLKISKPQSQQRANGARTAFPALGFHHCQWQSENHETTCVDKDFHCRDLQDCMPAMRRGLSILN